MFIATVKAGVRCGVDGMESQNTLIRVAEHDYVRTPSNMIENLKNVSGITHNAVHY